MLEEPRVPTSPGIGREVALAASRQRIGGAIWLLIVLRRNVSQDGVTVMGGAPLRACDLGRLLGVSPRQARRDLARLRSAGAVKLQNTGRGYRICLTGKTASEL